ncbi:MAG: right-handed parallel beta-helix repeat-containing protein [Acidobacterium ailaaui]|nr:right-handed parallel beta-helix repeat-containing protein [Pseudacidobacterium ailaaui]
MKMRQKRIVALLCILGGDTAVLPVYSHVQTTRTLYVSTNGSDGADGTRSHPFQTVARAQTAVRALNASSDVTVLIEDGTYSLDAPLNFRSEDGGQGSHHVTWQAAPGAHPIFSGGVRVTGWQVYKAAEHIYVADVPAGVNSRQLYFDGVLGDRTSKEIKTEDIEITSDELIIHNRNLAWLSKVKNPSQMELEVLGSFTDRYAPVESVQPTTDGVVLKMAQPSWANNTWGYDVPSEAKRNNGKHFYLLNALELMSEPNVLQPHRNLWYLDPYAGKLYVKLDEDRDINNITVMLPRLQLLLSIAGTYKQPIQNLTFKGLSFRYTTWLGPSENTGFASQQSGAYLKDLAPTHPSNAFQTCNRGCVEFESMRQHWSQIPAAIQVAAAHNVTFDHDSFSQLGMVGLGIGNDAGSNASGIGLGTDGVRVTHCHFAVLSAAAVLAGGVQKDAHHPSDPRMTNRHLMIDNNYVSTVSLDYKDNAGILSTYFDGAEIVHNDVSDLMYDGIDIGWGWGYNDQGGNPNYRDNQHGYTVNPVFQTPTILRNNLVAYNRIHGVKKYFVDGGAIYNLSSSPGTVIRNNYLFDLGDRIGLYTDEGSKHIRLLNNVVETQGFWLFANTVGKLYALKITSDNRAIGNWHNSDKTGERWIPESDCLILQDHLVANKEWPAEAQKVINESGIQPE